jgi:hypothetical protein
MCGRVSALVGRRQYAQHRHHPVIFVIDEVTVKRDVTRE